MSSRSFHMPIAGSSRNGVFLIRSRKMVSARAMSASSSSSESASSAFNMSCMVPSLHKQLPTCFSKHRPLTVYSSSTSENLWDTQERGAMLSHVVWPLYLCECCLRLGQPELHLHGAVQGNGG